MFQDDKPGRAGGEPPRLRLQCGGTHLSTLHVDAPVGLEVLSEVRATLFALRVHVVRTHAQVSAGRTTCRLEIVEFDGARLTPRRQRELSALLARTLGTMGHAEALPLAADSR